MKTPAKEARRLAIEAAAYSLIEERGFHGVSMLAISKRANASNETLYRWYGDKIGLFTALVQSNAAEVKRLLNAGLQDVPAPKDVLEKLGPCLLGLLTSERAIALNRAAAADASGTLGQALHEAGRGAIMPLMSDVFVQAKSAGMLPAMSAEEAMMLFFTLLIGDLQIRRAISVASVPTDIEIKARADWALSITLAQAKGHGLPA